MLSQLLVPLDGSPFAEAALPYALTISRRAGSRIDLVTVEEDPSSFPDLEWLRAASEWTRSYLEESASRIRPHAGGEVTTAQMQGRPWEAIVQRGEDTRADLAVMATHGRGALSRAWLGSVANDVVRHSHMPVLLVRPDEDAPVALDREVEISRVLVALDGSDFSRAILGPAVRFSHVFGAAISLLRVVSYPTELVSPYLPTTVQVNLDLLEEARVAAEQAMRAVADELRAQGVQVDADVVLESQAARAIVARADEIDAGAIALATHGRGGVSRAVMGSTADKVVRSARRPVLVLRPTDASAG